jgi:hypothetical protein
LLENLACPRIPGLARAIASVVLEFLKKRFHIAPRIWNHVAGGAPSLAKVVSQARR